MVVVKPDKIPYFARIYAKYNQECADIYRY